MRERYGEVVTKQSPLVREQFDRRDQFAIAHPRRVKEDVYQRNLLNSLKPRRPAEPGRVLK